MRAYLANKKNRKRTPSQREYDLTILARMYLSGSTQQQIAEFLSENRPYSLSRSQIAKDVKILHQRWLKSAMLDFNQAKARELARLDELERQAWQGWESSRMPGELVETVAIDDRTESAKGKIPTYSRRKAKKVQENRDGDVRFLQQVQACIERRCRIFGLDSPTRVNVDWRKEAEEAGVDAGELFNEMVGRFVNAAIDGEGRQMEQEPPDQIGLDDTDSDDETGE